VPEPQGVDPAVSRAKFDREIALYREMEGSYRSRGWFLLEAAFPEALVMFVATGVKPAAVAAAVLLDFTDYDLQPASVRFVDPFTRRLLNRQELNLNMLRKQIPPGVDPAMAGLLAQQGQLAMSDMIQANGLTDPPFVCLPGVREYHDNPAHSGDPWLLHRNSGEGSLAFILDKIWQHGVRPLQQYTWTMQATGLAAVVQAIPT